MNFFDAIITTLSSGVNALTPTLPVVDNVGTWTSSTGNFDIVVWDGTRYSNWPQAYRAGYGAMYHVDSVSGTTLTCASSGGNRTALIGSSIAHNESGHTYYVAAVLSATELTALQAAIAAKEPALGSPSEAGSFLTSTIPGVRSWRPLPVALVAISDNTQNLASGQTGHTTFGLGGSIVWTSVTTAHARLYLPAGTIRNLRAMAVATGGAGTCTVTLEVNGSPSALTTGSFATANADWNAPIVDSTHIVTLVDGDYVTISIAPTTRTVVAWSIYAEYAPA